MLHKKYVKDVIEWQALHPSCLCKSGFKINNLLPLYPDLVYFTLQESIAQYSAITKQSKYCIFDIPYFCSLDMFYNRMHPYLSMLLVQNLKNHITLSSTHVVDLKIQCFEQRFQFTRFKRSVLCNLV